MSRFPLKFATPISLLTLAGCMYPPMYQQTPYGQQAPYGQQMYAPPGNFAPSGTMVVPPSNAPLYTPGGQTYSLPTTPTPTDNFTKPEGSSDPRYFGPGGQVPLPSDPGTGTSGGDTSNPRPFSSDLDLPK